MNTIILLTNFYFPCQISPVFAATVVNNNYGVVCSGDRSLFSATTVVPRKWIYILLRYLGMGHSKGKCAFMTFPKSYIRSLTHSLSIFE